MNRYKKSGWFNESQRHSLARRGIKTGRKNYAKTMMLFKDLSPAEEAQLSPKMYKRYLKERGIKTQKDYEKYRGKINYAYTSSDLPGIVTTGLGTAGAEAVGWIPAIVAVGATKKIVKDIKKMTKKEKKKKKIDYYKISSISDKSKLQDIQQEINRRLKEKGYSTFVSVDDSSISLSDIRISEERVQEQGHNLQYSPYTKSGKRRTRALSRDDWVDVNDTVNDVLDSLGIKANVKSLGGKFNIRDKYEGRRTEQDWNPLATENVGSMMNPITRRDYINKPEKKEGTQFGVLGKEGKVEKQMTINIGKVKSSDPLAYSYGYFQAKSGQLMSKDKDLAPEYIRGYKDAKAGKKI